MMSALPAMKQSAEKQFKCTICDRGFTRIDHLKRHQLRHSGIKPYSCIFCNASFARCDNLRVHYSDCPQRGNRLVPETSQRGRRRHACESCTSMKLRCDGLTPCGSCQKRNVECIRQSTKPGSGDDNDSKTADSSRSEDYDQAYERGSVKFLLNSGTNSFTEGFRLPSREPSSTALGWIANYDGLDESMSTQRSRVSANDSGKLTSPTVIESQPVNAALYNDVFLQFFNNPFSGNHRQFSESSVGSLGAPPQSSPTQELNMPVETDQYFEPETAFSTNLIQSILSRTWVLGMDTVASFGMSQEARFLLTPSKIRKFVSLFFSNYHVNCPMIHYPTFDPEIVPSALLAAVVFMGAMYSDIPREVYSAKKLLDLAELSIFSTPVFSAEAEIARSYNSVYNQADDKNGWEFFQTLQAAYLMVITQYWGGNKAASSRMVELRMGEVVKISRKLQLTKARHDLEDRLNENLWLQKECRIRTICIISLLDCALTFYQNYPSQLTHSELQCDLPCEEVLFSSRHPFMEPNFRFSREMTVYQAFQNLFVDSGSVHTLFTSNDTGKLHLTILDMFLLIHQMYTYINLHLNVSMPLADQRSPDFPDSTTVTRIRIALEHWRSLWLTLRMEIPSHIWAEMGFYKSSYNYWLVSQLLLSKKASLDVLMKMDVKCDDKLRQLKDEWEALPWNF